MKTRIANSSQGKCWNRRNVAFNMTGTLIVCALAAFIAGYYELSALSSALTGLLLGGGVQWILINLFPLKTWEVTNVSRPRT